MDPYFSHGRHLQMSKEPLKLDSRLQKVSDPFYNLGTK